MKISRRSFTKIMASALMSTLTGCSTLFPTHRPIPEKTLQMTPRSDVVPRMIPSPDVLSRISPWFRSYDNAALQLHSDDTHRLEFSHWLEHGLVLDGKQTSFQYDKANHYQIGNRGPAIISDTYSVYEVEKLFALVTTPQPYWPADVNDVVKKIKSGKIKLNRGVIHWHRHHEKLRDSGQFKLTETYYMIIYAGAKDRDIPVLEMTHNSVAKYKRDALNFDVERIVSKAQSPDGLFRAPDSVVVHWQELPEILGLSRRNIFWVAADLEARNADQKIYYFCDETGPCMASQWDLFLLYSPDQHAGNVLTQFLEVILNRGEGGLTTFNVETISGINHYNYFYRDEDWVEADVGNSGLEMPNVGGDAFHIFLDFLDASMPGMVSYLGDGAFSVITQPRGSLVVENGTRTSSMVGFSSVAIDVGKMLGGPATGGGGSVAAAQAVHNYGESKGEAYRESTENQRKIDLLNQGGFLCGPLTPQGEIPDPVSAERLSDCRECVSASVVYDNAVDDARNRFVSGKASGAALTTPTGTRFDDYAENEAYADSIEHGAIRGCSHLM